jgi:hypothetical protein
VGRSAVIGLDPENVNVPQGRGNQRMSDSFGAQGDSATKKPVHSLSTSCQLVFHKYTGYQENDPQKIDF